MHMTIHPYDNAFYCQVFPYCAERGEDLESLACEDNGEE